MDRREARAILESMKLIDFRFAPKNKATEAIDLAIEALKGDFHCPKCGTIVRDGRQYHDLVYRGEAEQVTSKLKNPCDSLLIDDSEACKEQKSKLDCISRADAIAYIDRILNSGLGRNKSLDYIRKYISALPSAETHEIRTETHGVCLDCISRQQAVEAVEKHAKIFGEHSCPDEFTFGAVDGLLRAKELLEYLPPVTPTDQKTTETMTVDGEEIEIDPVSYEVGYTHGQFSERPKGEWEEVQGCKSYLCCSECGRFVNVSHKCNFCPNCGADMRGDTE